MPHPARLPILALALATLAAPTLAQEAPAEEQTEEAGAATEAAGEEDAGETQGGTGALLDAEGNQLGNVSTATTASGVVVVLINAEGIPEGVHGVHLHVTGLCEGPAFESAGDHISGDREHGVRAENGPHPGDLPNALVDGDGILGMEAFTIGLSEEMLYDEDGSALIVHANADDYESQPGGESGDRIACAVIEPPPGTLTDETVDAEDEAPAEESLATDEAQQEEETGQESDDRSESDTTLQGEAEGEEPAEEATEGSGG